MLKVYRRGKTGTKALVALCLAFLLFIQNVTFANADGTTVYGGVDYSPVYDFNFYVTYNQDLTPLFGNDPAGALNHFVNHGMAEGRRGNASFDVYAYQATYGDLPAALGDNLKAYYLHYINYGRFEGRSGLGNGSGAAVNPASAGGGSAGSSSQPSAPAQPAPQPAQTGVTVRGGINYAPVYDYNYYVSNNPDVVKALGTDPTAVLGHFVDWGMAEGRRGNATFDVRVYRDRYGDIQRLLGSDWKAIYMHYLQWGIAEGRSGSGTIPAGTNTSGSKSSGSTPAKPAPKPTPVTVYDGVDYSSVYNFDYYISHYSDIKEYYGNDPAGALRHFVTWGMGEKRRASESFDPQSYINEYSDLRVAFGSDYKRYFMHYLSYGRREGRHTTGCDTLRNPITKIYGYDIASIYDYDYYLANNPDAAYQGKEDFNVIKHFADYGIHQGRAGKANYNPADYEWFEKRMYADGMYERAQGYSSPTSYLIMVDLTHKLCGVYYGSQGNWNLVWKDVCGDGKPETPTPVAVTRVYTKYLYFDSGDVRLWYASPFNGSYYFHSVSYVRDSGPYVVDDPTIGTEVSHGCIRLNLDKAKWVYDNIPIGTTVVTYR